MRSAETSRCWLTRCARCAGLVGCAHESGCAIGCSEPLDGAGMQTR